MSSQDLSDSSDSDSISVTSTVASEVHDVYPIEGVLAEKKECGIKLYLVKWEGYEEFRNTWEPECNLHSETLEIWRERKVRIQAGLIPAYDVANLEAEQLRREQEKKKRRIRRLAKRRRRARPSSPTEQESCVEDASSIQQKDLPAAPEQTRSEIPTNVNSLGNKVVKPVSKQRVEELPTTLVYHSQSGHKNGEPLPKQKFEPSLRLETQSHPQNAGTKDPAPEPQKNGVWNMKPKRKSQQTFGRVGSGPAGREERGGVSGPDILKNWDKSPKSRKRKEPSNFSTEANADGPVKHFTKLSKLRKYELLGRDEPAPNADQLNFVNLGNGKQIQKPSGAITSQHPPTDISPTSPKTPWEQIQKGMAQQSLNTPREQNKTFEEELFVNDKHISGYQSPSAMDFECLVQSPGNDEGFDTGAFDVSRASLSEHPTPSSPPPVRRSPSRTFSMVTMSNLQKSKDASPEPWTERIRRRSLPSSAIDQFNAQTPSTASALRRRRQSSASIPRPLPIHYRGVYSMGLGKIIGDSGYNGQGHHGQADELDVYGNLILGERPNKIFNIEVLFRGLPRPVKYLVLTIKRPPKDVFVWMEQTCAADDYISKYHCEGEGYVGAGHIVPRTTGIESFQRLAQKFKQERCGGIFIAEHFIMLVYPPGPDWHFLDKQFPRESCQADLRFIVRSLVERSPGLSPATTCTTPKNSTDKRTHFAPKDSMDEQTQGSSKHFTDNQTVVIQPYSNAAAMETAPSQAPSSNAAAMETAPPQATILKERFGINYHDLIPLPLDDLDVLVLLYYPPEKKVEHDLLEAVFTALRHKVRSNYELVDWNAHTLATKRAIVLISAAEVCNLRRIRNLARMLRQPHINTFIIDLQPEGPSFLKKISNGAAFLLLDSLILCNPEYVLRLLKWFKRCRLHVKLAQSWKFAARPRFREWILNIVMDRRRNNAESAEIFKEIGNLVFREIVPVEHMDECDNFDTPTDEAVYASPVSIPGYNLAVGVDAPSDPVALAKNDELLCQWFGRWSADHILRHRKLWIILRDDHPNYKQVYMDLSEKYHHITTVTAKGFLQMNGVEKDENLYTKKMKAREEKEKLAGAALPTTT